MIEINEEYYNKLRGLNAERGRLKQLQNNFSKGLAIIEKEQMKFADNEFGMMAKKSLAVQLQVREARASKSYKLAVKNLGAVEHKLAIVEGEIDIMNKMFDHYRTMSADRRAYG